MPYWNEISAAANDRATTADLWSRIRDQADQLGLSSPGVSVQGVNELRRLATSIERSGRALTKASETSGIEPGMIGEAPWSRALQDRGGIGIFQVRYKHSFIDSEGLQSEWRTSVFNNGLPATVGELRANIIEDANQLANKYKVEHVGTDFLRILVV